MASSEERIGLVGPGRLGMSLAAALRDLHFEVVEGDPRVGGRSDPEFADCVAIFLTVPDGRIAEVAKGIRWRPGQFAVHCSGALGLDTLRVARDAGALAGCLHPLQSFPNRSPEPWRFSGISCGVEGDGPLGEWLESLAIGMGAHPFRLEGADRALYHAAAVTMNNLAMALAATAAELWVGAGLPAEDARRALSPLLAAAAHNITAMPLNEALTGPIARGDTETVRAHLHAMESLPGARELYRRLSLRLLDLPLSLPAAKAAELRKILGPGP